VNVGSDACIDCDGIGRYPSGEKCKSCDAGRVLPGDGIAAPLLKMTLALRAARIPGIDAGGADLLLAAIRDAERYRWLRDGNAYAPEEEHVRGGEDLDYLCDTKGRRPGTVSG
jgi:hypothetical protein